MAIPIVALAGLALSGFLAPRIDGSGTGFDDAAPGKVMMAGESTSNRGATRVAPRPQGSANNRVTLRGEHGRIASQAFVTAPLDPGEPARLAGLDAYWSEVSRAVKEGDFEAYRATCHAEGVLVSGSKRTSQPLADALARWKQEFLDTRAGKLEASVEFRFARRLGDPTTAHESGIFLYRSRPAGGEAKQEYVHFEALLVKRQDGWKILMEYQKGPATAAEWQALE
jgi:hypothetical protein